MDNLFRAGAFQGEKASDAYFVRVRAAITMTQDDIDRGQVIVVVGFAPLKPAELSSCVSSKRLNSKGDIRAGTLVPANAHRFDPYRTYKFQVVIDDNRSQPQEDGALKKKTEPIKWRTAGDPSHERVLPGGTSYEPIVLEQGLTQDPVFEAWANLVNNVEATRAMSLRTSARTSSSTCSTCRPRSRSRTRSSAPGFGLPGRAGARRPHDERRGHPVDHAAHEDGARHVCSRAVET